MLARGQSQNFAPDSSIFFKNFLDQAAGKDSCATYFGIWLLTAFSCDDSSVWFGAPAHVPRSKSQEPSQDGKCSYHHHKQTQHHSEVVLNP